MGLIRKSKGMSMDQANLTWTDYENAAKGIEIKKHQSKFRHVSKTAFTGIYTEENDKVLLKGAWMGRELDYSTGLYHTLNSNDVMYDDEDEETMNVVGDMTELLSEVFGDIDE